MERSHVLAVQDVQWGTETRPDPYWDEHFCNFHTDIIHRLPDHEQARLAPSRDKAYS